MLNEEIKKISAVKMLNSHLNGKHFSDSLPPKLYLDFNLESTLNESFYFVQWIEVNCQHLAATFLPESFSQSERDEKVKSMSINSAEQVLFLEFVELHEIICLNENEGLVCLLNWRKIAAEICRRKHFSSVAIRFLLARRNVKLNLWKQFALSVTFCAVNHCLSKFSCVQLVSNEIVSCKFNDRQDTKFLNCWSARVDLRSIILNYESVN